MLVFVLMNILCCLIFKYCIKMLFILISEVLLVPLKFCPQDECFFTRLSLILALAERPGPFESESKGLFLGVPDHPNLWHHDQSEASGL